MFWRFTGSATSRAGWQLVISPAPAVRLIFLTPPVTVPVGRCSPAVKIGAMDVYDNEAPVNRNALTTLSLSSASGLIFYSDVGCTKPVSSLRFSSGAYSATVYFKAGTPKVYPLTVSGTGLVAASQEAQVTATP
ncbi:hypothetical protein ACLESD_03210 [Pyxidicoccus sp. 3LFB2]